MKMIYVDDDATNRTVLRQMLATAGVKMDEAADARTGLRMIAESNYDLIVMDLRMFKVATSTVSLIDDGRQWFKAKVGLDVCETDRDTAFCNYAVLQDDMMIVPDAHADERFAANPLVTGPPFIRFYAGAPLTTPGGFNIGTLCVFDPEPRAGAARRPTRHAGAA